MSNAVLTLLDSNNERVDVPLWLADLSLPRDLQMSTSQTKQGRSHDPVRVQEQFLSFSVLFPQNAWQYAELLSALISFHFVNCLNQSNPTPMELLYKSYRGEGKSRLFRGFIEQTPRGAERFRAMYVRSFRMRLINSLSSSTSETVFGSQVPYLPTARSIESFASRRWYYPDALSVYPVRATSRSLGSPFG